MNEAKTLDRPHYTSEQISYEKLFANTRKTK